MMTTPSPARAPEKSNPASAAPKAKVEPERIPMSVPHQRLAVPEIEGYHTHWFAGEADRIDHALKAGYQFVSSEEIGILNRDLAGNNEPGGGTDLGTRVSVAAGGLIEGSNQPRRLYLMKLPIALWEQDQAGLAQVNEAIAAKLRGDDSPFSESGSDNSHRYTGKQKQTLFHPKN